VNDKLRHRAGHAVLDRKNFDYDSTVRAGMRSHPAHHAARPAR
jgi:hypothetical protein